MKRILATLLLSLAMLSCKSQRDTSFLSHRVAVITDSTFLYNMTVKLVLTLNDTTPVRFEAIRLDGKPLDLILNIGKFESIRPTTTGKGKFMAYYAYDPRNQDSVIFAILYADGKNISSFGVIEDDDSKLVFFLDPPMQVSQL